MPSKALVPFFNGPHNYLLSRSGHYHSWHLHPDHKKVHWTTLSISFVLVMAVLFNSFFPENHAKASSNTKSWSTSADFAGQTLSNIDTTDDKTKIASTTENFVENFTTATYKGAGTTADWNTTGNKLTLTGDPTNGVTTDLASKWTAATGITSGISSTVLDTDTGYIYLGGKTGRFGYYNPTTDSVTNLTARLTTWEGGREIYNMVYDSYYKYIYLTGPGWRTTFGAFKTSSDPTNGTYINLADKLPADVSSVEAIGYDSVNHYIYYTKQPNYSGAFPAIENPANIVAGNFTVLAGFGGGQVKDMAFDTTNSVMYAVGSDNAFKGIVASNPPSGSWTNLVAKMGVDMNEAGYLYGIAIDPINHLVYVGGGEFSGGGWYNRFGVITAVANPSAAVYTSLTSNLASSTGPPITSLTYGDGKIFVGSNQKFGIFSGGNNPAAGSFTDLGAKISSFWAAGNLVESMTYNSANATLYLAGLLGTSNAEFASYQLGYNNDLIGVSTKLNSTTSPISKVTLTATENLPANTSIVYYLSNDGGSTWNTVSSGSEYAFTVANNNLWWKAVLATTNLSATPEITNVSISYTYYNSATGSVNFILDATQTAAWTSMSWNQTSPAGSLLTFKIRGGADSTLLSQAAWSSVIASSASPLNLQSFGLADSRWIEIEADLSTSDFKTSPELFDLSLNYTINTAPEIQNVAASQLTDGSKNVGITYDLKDSDTATNSANISLQYSLDSGDNWLNCLTTTGTGAMPLSTNFANKSASWNAGVDLGNVFYNNTVQIRVKADDVELAHNLASADSGTFPLDTKPPLLGSIGLNSGIQIGSGATWVNSTTPNLTLLASDDSEKQMQIRNDTNFDANYIAYSGDRAAWPLSNGDGNKTVAVRFRDAFGNTTDASANVLLDTTAPPIPTNIGIYDSSDDAIPRYAMTILWDPIDVGDMDHYVIERKVNEGSFAVLATLSEYSYTDLNLDDSNTYTYRVKAVDTHANSSGYSDTVVLQPNSGDTTPPVVTGSLPTIAPSDESAIFTWNTNEPSDSYVEFGTTNSLGIVQGSDAPTMSHSVTIMGLTPSTTYYYKVRSKDAAGNVGYSSTDPSVPSFATLAEQNPTDTTAPSITSPNPEVNADHDSVTISWDTDEDSDSYVEFGISAGYGTTQGSDDLTGNHSVTIENLNPVTTYHFRVKSKDAQGNQAVSDDNTFATLADTDPDTGGNINITGATAQKPGANPEEVTIIWTTDRYATSQVLYGTTEELGEQTIEDQTLNKTHYVAISGLKSNTKYYYRARSEDAQNTEVLGEIKFFITSQNSQSMPSISAVEISDISLNAAIISWESTVVTTSSIEYGPDISYGSRIEDLSLGSTTKHVIRLKDLSSGIKYHFRVVGDTSEGSTISSDDYVFSTLTTPEITSLQVGNIASNEATVTWKTNTETDSYIDFGVDKIDQSQGSSDLVMDHAVRVIGLKPASQIKFRIKSRDKYSNQAISAEQFFTTIADTAPPVIRDLKSETSVIANSNGESKAQVIVSWSTDEPATSQIHYAMGVAAGSEYPLSTVEDTNLTTSHIIILSSLQLSKTYHVKVVSKDGSNNIGTSDDYTVLTQNQDKSLVQYIVQILEERFFWLKQFGIFG